MSKKADAQLVEGIKSGDGSAFKTFVEQYQDSVFNVCLGFVGNTEEAEDISQEVFIEIFGSIDSFKGESALDTWTYRIAVNKSLERIKYLKRGKRFAWLTSLFGKEESIGNFHKTDLHPGVRLENEEVKEQLVKAIDRLPETQRTAFVLSKYEQLSNKEVAEIMNQSVSGVESLLVRGKRKLQELLKDYYNEHYG